MTRFRGPYVLLLLIVTGFTALATAEAAPGSRPGVPATRPRIVALGDSLTAGLGLSTDQAYPAVLQERLDAGGYSYEIVNAGVSGDTSAGGLRRLEWALDGDVRILILALGANDGLRGVAVTEVKKNLTTIVERARGRGITVLLVGMEAPPNFGPSYTNAYRRVFQEIAKQYSLAFVPFLLEGVAGIPRLNQPDGIHPTAAGARIVADHLWTVLKPMVDAASHP
jgi:acyl-CoA thioesterase-1